MTNGLSLFDTDSGGVETSLVDLLEIENTPELLTLLCPQTGIPVWAVLRIAFLRQIMRDLLFGTGVIDPPAQRNALSAEIGLGRAALHNAASVIGRNLRSDILMHTDAIGDQCRDGRWFNRYADPFGDFPGGQAVVLTDMFNWQWHTPRHNDRIVYHAPLQVRAALAARLPGKATAWELARTATSIVCERASALIGWKMSDGRRGDFIKWAAQKIAALPIRYRAYDRLLRRVRPRLLLGLAGCYGAHAPLIAAARDRDIVTAEFQHGAISGGHDAYNFAPEIGASEAYRRTLPQYLLTYGAWWGAQVNAPVESVVIGNPSRKRQDRYVAAPRDDRRTILILGDGIEFELYLDLALKVAAALSGTDLNVVLRPHPLERDSVLRRYGKQVRDIRIDVVPDIYASFAGAHTVVSELSTGLFEAVGFVDRVILLSTAKARFAYPKHPFVEARSPQEVVDWVTGRSGASIATDADDLWSPGWRENYAWFLRDKVGIG